MKRFILFTLVASGILAGWQASADHDKSCKNIHGKVTVVAEDGITVGDKLYKVGKSSRVTKDGNAVTLDKISPGDLVCLDARGKDDIGGGEVASVTILTASDPIPVREKVVIRETETLQKTSEDRSLHDRNCNHLHGKITHVGDSAVVVGSKPFSLTTGTLVTKNGQITTVEKIKSGDFVCVDETDDNVVSITVLSPSDTTPVQSREIIHEKVREQK